MLRGFKVKNPWLMKFVKENLIGSWSSCKDELNGNL